MNRNKISWVGGAMLGALALCGPPAARAEERKPNIVVIVADDLGWGELGVQGNKDIPTPNIDAIAAGGVRFTNAYVTCPVCSPTRAGLLTGRYQQRFGHEFNPGPPDQAEENFGLPLTQTTLADRLKTAGYATGMVGKWHLGYKPEFHPQRRGFDEFFGFLAGAHAYNGPARGREEKILRGTEPVEEPGYLTEAFGREAAAFIDRHAAAPFFLYLPFNAVHSPMQGAEKYLARFPDITDPKRRTFAAMLSALDDAVGVVTAKLCEKGIEENTLIFFTSDNGGPTQQTTSGNGPLRGFKGQVFEGGFREPFFMKWKGRLPEGKVVDRTVVSLDIAPTALAAAGAKAADAGFDGIDILPLAHGDADAKWNETLYWRYGKQAAIRRGDMKLLRFDGPEWELYNLKDDIGEKKNLAAEQPEVVKELGAAWDAWSSQLMPPQWRKGGGADAAGAGRRRRAN